jgi:6-phosphogluconolactonase (cycloisomerase 2 family)
MTVKTAMKTKLVYTFTLLAFASSAYANGFVYVHTNEIDNKIIVYKKNGDGSLTELKRIPTSGKGVGETRPLHNGKPGPDPLASGDALIMAKNSKFLFAPNAGDNSVSAFKIGTDGMPTLLDREASNGDIVNTLAYHEASNTLYVGHLRGPQHIKVMDFKNDDLVLRKNGHSLETEKLKGRLQSHVLVSPKGDYLLSNVLADQKPDGSGIHGSEEENLVVFPIGKDGSLATPHFHTLKAGKEPFSSIFVKTGENMFLTLFSESNNVTLHQLGSDGKVTQLSDAKGDDSKVKGKPLEYCWVALTPDHSHAYVTSFGTSDVASFRIDGSKVSYAKGGLAKVPPGNDFKAGAGIPTSAPVDSWGSDDGYFYQLYGAIGKLGAYKMTKGGGLKKIALYDVPVNSIQGITGY